MGPNKLVEGVGLNNQTYILEALVSFSIVIQVWGRVEAALCFTCYKQHLTLSDPAHTQTHTG